MVAAAEAEFLDSSSQIHREARLRGRLGDGVRVDVNAPAATINGDRTNLRQLGGSRREIVVVGK